MKMIWGTLRKGEPAYHIYMGLVFITTQIESESHSGLTGLVACLSFLSHHWPCLLWSLSHNIVIILFYFFTFLFPHTSLRRQECVILNIIFASPITEIGLKQMVNHYLFNEYILVEGSNKILY